MNRIYSLIDRDQYPEEMPSYVFESSLTVKQIDKIERQAEKEYVQNEPHGDYKYDIMIRLIKKLDKKFRYHRVRVLEY